MPSATENAAAHVDGSKQLEFLPLKTPQKKRSLFQR